MINRVTNLPTVSSGYSELYCRSGASRKSGGAERSGAWADVAEKRWSGARSGRSRSGNGAGVTEIGLYWSAERLFCRSRSAHILCHCITLV